MRILDYRGHQRKLLPRLARSFALMLAQNALVDQMHRIASGEETSEDAQRELEARAAGIKALTTEHATDTIQVCREACGGAGYMSVNRFADLKADTDVFSTFEGDNTVLLPWAIAAVRGNANAWAVFWVNLLLGWTVVGWIVALVMSIKEHRVISVR